MGIKALYHSVTNTLVSACDVVDEVVDGTAALARGYNHMCQVAEVATLTQLDEAQARREYRQKYLGKKIEKEEKEFITQLDLEQL